LRTKSDEKWQQIIDTATSIFALKGFENTSMADISAKVGGSKATIYNYFKSKEEIFIEAVKCFASSKKAQMLECLQVCNGDIREILFNYGVNLLELITKPEVIAARRMIFSPTTSEELAQLFYEKGAKQATEILSNFLRQQIEKGAIIECDELIAARTLNALLIHNPLEFAMYQIQTEYTRQEIEKFVEQALFVFLSAYRTKD
jgi:AcrR family transcriptional regulator